ncbi:MAG TPA: AraC family transcriptional regulator [Longimicrobiales bacterium]|nr:AraC family transcriptional regulator [Longimicrobiales bacterium]
MRTQQASACGCIAKRSTSLFDVGLYRLDDTHDGPAHEHGRPAIAWGVTGAMQVVGRQRRDEVFPAPPLFIPADYRHSERVPFGVAMCILATPRSDDFPGRFRAGIGVLRNPSVRDTGRALMREIAEGDDVTDLAIDAALLEALAALTRAGRAEAARAARADWMRQVEERLADEFANPPSAAQLAREAGVTPAHLSRAFRRTHGVSVPRYLRRLRLQRAAALLAGTDRPISDIALAAGFYDQSHLTRVFRQALGVTPGVYRSMVWT